MKYPRSQGLFPKTHREALGTRLEIAVISPCTLSQNNSTYSCMDPARFLDGNESATLDPVYSFEGRIVRAQLYEGWNSRDQADEGPACYVNQSINQSINQY